MKNKINLIGFIAIVAVIGFSFTACGEDPSYRVENTNGTMTISGLSAYDGKYVRAISRVNNVWLDGYANIKTGDYYRDDDGGTDIPAELGRIAGGSVTLKVWKITDDGFVYSNYNGSGQVSFGLEVFDAPNLNLNVNKIKSGSNIGEATVNFTNGVGSGNKE